jgi:hypothetical protein
MNASLAFDDQLRTALDRLAQELMRAAADERGRAVSEAADAAAAEVRRQAQTQLTQFREVAQRHADELRRAADTQIAQLKGTLEQTRQAADQQLAAARSQLTAEAEARRVAQGEAEAVRSQARQDIDAIRQQSAADLEMARGTARAELDEARRTADAALAELRSTTDRRISELSDDIAHVRKTAASEAEELVVAQLSAAAGETGRRLTDAVDRAKTDHHQTVLAQSARLANAVRSLDEGRSLGEVLDALAQCAGHEVERAAVLIVKGERLRGWALSGFGTAAPPARNIDLSLEEAGLPGAVVPTGVAVSRPAVDPGMSAERQPALPPFAQDAGSRHALALPITVAGAVVAVLYADAARAEAPSASSRWPAILEVLARHTSRVLEAMTVQQAAGLPLPRLVTRASHAQVPGPIEQAAADEEEEAARRYARLLLSEIRMYNEPLVDAGRRSRDLLSRLGGEIARARRLYEARVPSSVIMRADYFDQELVRTLADGDRSLLGGVQ